MLTLAWTFYWNLQLSEEYSSAEVELWLWPYKAKAIKQQFLQAQES